MIPMRISGATQDMGAPQGWNPEKDGNCCHLSVRVDGNVFQSAWEPTPAELAALNAGGHVILSVVGGQPPVMLSVEPASSSKDSASVSAEKISPLLSLPLIGFNVRSVFRCLDTYEVPCWDFEISVDASLDPRWRPDLGKRLSVTIPVRKALLSQIDHIAKYVADEANEAFEATLEHHAKK